MSAIDHQDRSGNSGAPLGVFLDGIRVGLARPGEEWGALRDRVAADHPGEHLEILLTCISHPDTSAVDCLDCAPDPTT